MCKNFPAFFFGGGGGSMRILVVLGFLDVLDENWEYWRQMVWSHMS